MKPLTRNSVCCKVLLAMALLAPATAALADCGGGDDSGMAACQQADQGGLFDGIIHWFCVRNVRNNFVNCMLS